MLIGGMIITKLFFLQVVDDSYKLGASANAIRKMVDYPLRGEIFDRNGEYLAQSREAYDIMVVPIDIVSFDTLKLASILEVSKEDIVSGIAKAKRYSYRSPSVLFKQMPKEIKMRLDEYTFPGFFTQYRTIRSYPFHTAGNILGYISEVNQSMIENDNYYRAGDYAGMIGIERAYEKELRGKKGTRMELVDVHGMPQGSYRDGLLDTLPVSGESLVSTIDWEIQKLGEELMQGKRGSILAIEPQTGEILMMVSSPTYNPDDLIGRSRSKNFSKLLTDKGKPMFNRAVMSPYPPGSTFKLANALIGLQEEVITTESHFTCYNGFSYGSRKLGCHSHAPDTDFSYSIQTSCNAYYCHVYKRILENSKYENIGEAFTSWRDHLLSMGFGRKLDSDFIGELNGYIPTAERYDQIYNGRWNAYTIISNSIGQGEIGVTPLQLVNFISSIANKGYYYVPHIIKKIGEDGKLDDRFYEKHYTSIDHKHYDPVVEAMWKAVNVSGTAVRCAIPGQDVCGKTGTAQNSGRDHSTFAAFAPKDNPKIAISAYVENGGFGATIALPITKLILEKYLTGEVQSTALMEQIKAMEVYYKN
ncbi:MAG: penicillin-binding transpeptidase domain-containing protein [Rikenellaceae bacterium]